MKNRRFAKISVMAASIMIMGSAALFAQRHGGYGRDRQGPPPMGAGMHCGEFQLYDMLQKQLGLTDKQVRQIFDIDQKYREKFFDNRRDVDKMLELRVEQRKEVKKIMTAEQQKKFDQMFLERGCGRGGPYGNPPDKDKSDRDDK
jgi:Spy/CpxP family protein refolding chaperone